MTSPVAKKSPGAGGTRTRKASSTPPAALWDAFDEVMALLPPDATSALSWCSPAFAALLALPEAHAEPALTALCARLVGLAQGVAALSNGGARQAAWDGAVQLQAGDGAQATLLLASLRRLPDGALALRLRPTADGAAADGPAHDRATRRHLEDRERLLFTSRSVAVGEMATTLAHELNQPLGAVTNVLRGLKARITATIAQPQPGALPMLEQGVQLALDQVQYAARIIGRIRDYTQSRQPRRERVDLHALLHNSLTLLDWDLGRHGVQLTLELALSQDQDSAAAVAGDGVMLQQVLVNLLRNGIDAMSDTPAGQRRLQITSRVDRAGGQIEIAIADTGIGIDDEGAAQLFMPFYSTKPTGMGIGLNICRSLIELHQGRLWYTPNTGRGCTFHVALPLVQGEEARQLPRFMDSDSTVA
ncbi:sensor histidine kinase [Ottowia flava]|nr:sensor histidine kinase [Ottowia sp. GY511]